MNERIEYALMATLSGVAIVVTTVVARELETAGMTLPAWGMTLVVFLFLMILLIGVLGTVGAFDVLDDFGRFDGSHGGKS